MVLGLIFENKQFYTELCIENKQYMLRMHFPLFQAYYLITEAIEINPFVILNANTSNFYVLPYIL